MNPDAVYGFSPNPASERIGILAAKDWSDGVFVNNEKRNRIAAYKTGYLLKMYLYTPYLWRIHSVRPHHLHVL